MNANPLIENNQVPNWSDGESMREPQWSLYTYKDTSINCIINKLIKAIAPMVAAATHELASIFSAKVSITRAEAAAAAFFAKAEIEAATVDTALNLSKEQPADMDVLQDVVERVAEKSRRQDKSTIKRNGKPKQKPTGDPKRNAKKQRSSQPSQPDTIDMPQEETDSNEQASQSVSQTNNASHNEPNDKQHSLASETLINSSPEQETELVINGNKSSNSNLLVQHTKHARRQNQSRANGHQKSMSTNSKNNLTTDDN
eukprot:1210529-Ditylum_brightwellii.AAC.1